MRVLVVAPGPHFSVADVYTGVVNGLRQNGCTVAIANLDDRLDVFTASHVKLEDGTYRQAFQTEDAVRLAGDTLLADCYKFWPDVIVVISGFFIPPEIWGILRQRPHRVVYWATESPYEDDRQGRPGRYADCVILNDPTNLEQFRNEINPNTHFFPHSYDPAIHFPGPGRADLECDFSFVGTGFPSRVEWFEKVDWSGIDARFGGHWRELSDDSPLHPLLLHRLGECMDNVTTASLYRSSKASLNLYRKEHSEEAHALGWAMGPREVELAACETFFFRESRDEGDELFPQLPIVHSPEDFADQLRWWLAHDDLRTDAARKARIAIESRTFKNSTARLLRVLDALPRKIAA